VTPSSLVGRYYQGCTIFPNIYVPRQSFRRQGSDVNTVPKFQASGKWREHSSKVSGVREVTWTQFHTGYPNILGTTTKYLIAMANRRTALCNPETWCSGGRYCIHTRVRSVCSETKYLALTFIVTRVRLSGPAERVVTPYSPATAHHSKCHHMPELTYLLTYLLHGVASFLRS